MTKSSTVILLRKDAEVAFRALDDAQAEIEAFEKDAPWYTASSKMMDRIEDGAKALKDALA
jgi:hypothetical protein